MFRFLPPIAALLSILALAPGAEARELTLQIQNGVVTLRARDVTIREILAEWGRVGQTRIVNAERLQGGLVTLELHGVSERQALDVLLRAASGYMAAPRPVPTETASMFDRILVLATTSSPPAAAPPRFAPMPPPSASPPPNIFTAEPGVDTSDTGGVDTPDAQPGGAPSPTLANPAMNRFFPAIGPGQRFRPAEAQPPNVAFDPNVAAEIQDPDNTPDTSAPAGPTAANPFGSPAGTSSRPGIVIQPPPTQSTVPQVVPFPTR